jgi:outer membrane protein assembly factor BamB
MRAFCSLVGCLLMIVAVARSAVAVDEIRTRLTAADELPDVKPAATDWPWWRGPDRNNVARPQSVPFRWDAPESIQWKVPVPGRGFASPVTWGQRLYLLTADEDAKIYSLLAYDRQSGERLWTTELHRGGFMKDIHSQCSHASATPACDSERVFSVLIHDRALWVSANGHDGKTLWQTNVAPYDAIYGFGSSPVIYGSLVIVAGDNDQTGSFLAALHRGTGRIVWRIKRPLIDTYATPIVLRVAGRDQLLLGGCGFLGSYDPNTGDLLWRCDGPTAETTANTAVADGERVYVAGGYPKPYALMAVRADGSGDVTATHKVWSLDKAMPYVPSPLYHDGLLYIADDYGIATCLDAPTGKKIWQKRLGGDFTSSPLICGDRLFVINESGTVFALSTGQKSELLATSELNDQVMATPIICGGYVYIRTAKHLICLGEPTKP